MPVPPIEPFEDERVAGVRLILTRTGDGLSKSVKIAPVVLHRGDRVQLVCEAVTAKIRFEEAAEGDGVDRVQILECEAMFVVDDPQVKKLIAQQVKAQQQARELEGQGSLTVEEDD